MEGVSTAGNLAPALEPTLSSDSAGLDAMSVGVRRLERGDEFAEVLGCDRRMDFGGSSG